MLCTSFSQGPNPPTPRHIEIITMPVSQTLGKVGWFFSAFPAEVYPVLFWGNRTRQLVYQCFEKGAHFNPYFSDRLNALLMKRGFMFWFCMRSLLSIQVTMRVCLLIIMMYDDRNVLKWLNVKYVHVCKLKYYT